MIVVSDTTPLISLLKADALSLLEPLFKEVLVPDAVFSELTSNPDFQMEAEIIRKCPFIKVVTVKEPEAVKLLQRATGLDLGESEAIIYADDTNADVLLMDEIRGRQVAKSMGIYIMGTIGVLLFAYEEKILSGFEVAEILDKLKKSNRHISDELIEYALSKIQL